jgi:hypothetical protein
MKSDEDNMISKEGQLSSYALLEVSIRQMNEIFLLNI